ncbi:MAG: DUF4205 domain-containing protein, partial [Methanobacteriota archaeon]
VCVCVCVCVASWVGVHIRACVRARARTLARSTPVACSQHSGGPCGILSAVQAFTLFQFLFQQPLTQVLQASIDASAAAGISAAAAAAAASLKLTPRVPGGDAAAWAAATAGITDAQRQDVLATALAFVLWQASEGRQPVSVFHLADAARDLTPACTHTDVVAVRVASFAALQTHMLLSLEELARPCGVVLFVLSLVASRGLDAIKGDSDEDTDLIARFGHCSQELLNLCLLGRAVSNIFDGDQFIGEGDGKLTLHGVHRRPLVGYLSHAEAMRYTTVGDYFKTPCAPLWIIGSESHFTVLFGLTPDVNDESPSGGAYRAFKKFDAHDNKFIPVCAWQQAQRVWPCAGMPASPHCAALHPAACCTLRCSLETWARC